MNTVQEFQPTTAVLATAVPVEVEETGRYTYAELATLVMRIHAGDVAAMEDMYNVLSSSLSYLRGRLGYQDASDKIHDVFVIVIGAIRRGELRDPRRLMGFVKTVLHRQIAAHVKTLIKCRARERHIDDALQIVDRREHPEEKIHASCQTRVMQQALKDLSVKEREILERFHLEQQGPAQICEEMQLTPTQYRLLKSRAKAKLTKLGQRQMRPGLRRFVAQSVPQSFAMAA